MSIKKNMNWEEFDKIKSKSNSDSRYFSFKDWEIEFLIKEINLSNPEFKEIEILRAILSSCETVQSPNLKIDFYQSVMDKLKNES